MTKTLLALLAGSIMGHMWTVWRVLRPIKRLSQQARHLSQGNMTALEQQCGGIREIGDLRHTMASMAQHVQRAQAEGLSYRHALTEGQEAERARIAHELHDDTVQSLIAIAQSLELSSAWLDSDPARAKELLRTARTQAVESVSSLRRLIADLRPPALQELGIVAALRMLADETRAVPVDVRVEGIERRIGNAHELALFRIAQEALRNAVKHAQTPRVHLHLTFAPHTIHLVIRDEGRGITPTAAFEGADGRRVGLLGMQERVQQFNGRFTLTSQPGLGTTIEVMLPLAGVAQPTESVRDPVCGVIIVPQQAFGSTLYKEVRYYFCCPVCQGAFQKQPDVHVL